MNTFFDLFVSHSSPEWWADSTWADRRFPELVGVSPFRLWQPGDSIPARGVRILIGVATWCGYDMRLLDRMTEALSGQPMPSPIVEVFNMVDCQQPQDFDRYIKGLGIIHHPPVMGFWQDAELTWSGQGHNAYEFLAPRFGFNADEIGAFVQNWIKARAHA